MTRELHIVPASRKALLRLQILVVMLLAAAVVAAVTWERLELWSLEGWTSLSCGVLLAGLAASFAADAYLAQHDRLVLDADTLRVRTGFLRHFTIPASSLLPIRA